MGSPAVPCRMAAPARLKPEARQVRHSAGEEIAGRGWLPDGFGITIHAPNKRYVNDEQIAQAVAQC